MSKRTSLALLFMLVLAAATAPAQESIVYYATGNGSQRTVTVHPGPKAVPCTDCEPAAASQPATPAAKPDKISEGLRAALAGLEPNARLRLVVEFPENVPMPRFPKLDKTKPHSDAKNVAVLERRAAMARSLAETRAAANRGLLADLARLGVDVRHSFWITNSVVAEVPAGLVEALSKRGDIKHIQLERTSVPPPSISAGRTVIQSDWIYNMTGYNLNYWLIALLDSGMPITAGGTITHTLFDAARIRGFDCVNSTGSPCTTAAAGRTLNPRDDCWNHGISSASILTANSNLTDTYRGVTRFNVDGYKVYEQNGTGYPGCTVDGGGNPLGLNTTAAQWGFQAAIASGADIIVAEIQDWKGSVLTTAADNAYDAGVAVIAAAGNAGSGAGTIRSPGEAHKAIAVGAVDYSTLATPSYQGRGPESDGRIKPEIQGPTNTVAASNTSFTGTQSFSGTSGSTPYVGGAATLFGWWNDSADVYSYAGYIYNDIIRYGDNWTNPTSNNTTGSGVLRMPNGGFCGGSAWGVMQVGPSQQVEDTLNFFSPCAQIMASLWWPEGAAQTHNNVDLAIVDPSGVVRATSTSVNSIFEKARYIGTIGTGGWKVRLTRGSGGTAGNQAVYFYVDAR